MMIDELSEVPCFAEKSDISWSLRAERLGRRNGIRAMRLDRLRSLSIGSRGSALVESAILLVIMVPVLFGVVMIGKLIDLRQTTEQAGRYTAWEATVHPVSSPRGSAPFAVQERFFGVPSNHLQSAASEAGSNSLWGEQADKPSHGLWAQSAVRIDESGSMGLAYQRGVGTPGLGVQVGQQIASSGEILDGIADNEWGLESDGLVRGGVQVDVQQNGWLTSAEQQCGRSGVAGCVQSSSVILVDGWSSSDDAQASRRVKSLVPASALESVGNAVSLVGAIPMFKELRELDGAFGHVDMTVLPAYALPGEQ